MSAAVIPAILHTLSIRIDCGATTTMNPREPLDVPLIAKVDFLSNASNYPHRPSGIEAIETHMSWVFLTKHHAYKLKKPILLDYIDYRTIEARRRFCEAEVTLNRRLAPGVYLGTVPLAHSEGDRLGLHGDGVVVDWLVQMRRLPLEQRLDARLATGQVNRQRLADVFQKLLAAYQDVAHEVLAADSYPRRLEIAIRRNRAALDILDRSFVIEQQDRFLTDQHHMIAARAPFIVDAHGDLRPEHVYLVDPPVILDRLEFDRDLRLLDPVDELAFFAIECGRLGADWIGDFAFSYYQEHTGDVPPPALIAFYKSLRACMRVRLALGHLAEPAADRISPWFRLAEHYAEMAVDYAADMAA
jgi:aminoglycoside phosphotransferase family enzyme